MQIRRGSILPEANKNPMKQKTSKDKCHTQDIALINTGGTLEKVYDDISERFVFPRETSIEKMLDAAKVTGVQIQRHDLVDSINMTPAVRANILEAIEQADERGVIVIHGTSTITATAKYLREMGVDKTVVLTGASNPYKFDPTEAAANVGMAIVVARYFPPGVYVALHGIVDGSDAAEVDIDRALFTTKREE